MLLLAFALSFFGQHWDKYDIYVNELNLRKTEGFSTLWGSGESHTESLDLEYSVNFVTKMMTKNILQRTFFLWLRQGVGKLKLISDDKNYDEI